MLGDELQSSRFVAIPRGGMIVLGMLSYCMGLTHEQLQLSGARKNSLTVVVDDCCLSGARFSKFIESLDSSRVVFAHLFSQPKVRYSILGNETRVEACLAAQNLAERSGYQSKRIPSVYLKKLPGRRYWLC